MENQRFSLLILEPGEVYFDDLSVQLQSGSRDDESNHVTEIGRLKICSKSLVFDPKDYSKPLVKILLKDCTRISKYEDHFTPDRPDYIPVVHGCVPEFRGDNSNKNVLQVVCKQYAEIFEDNVVAPYKFKNVGRTFLFSLNYAHINNCLPLITQLFKAADMTTSDHNKKIAALERERQKLVKFDPLWLEGLHEKIILETTGHRISPLVMNLGRITLTTSTLYYQPFNKIELYHVLPVRLSRIKRMTKRRFLLRHTGLELSYEDKHLYLSLKSCQDRDKLYELIMEQPELDLEESQQEIMTLQWQNGVISNYDYLLYLNSHADRTFNDLTQYPVFPWVISDYISPNLDLDSERCYRDLSKPIGALNMERLHKLKERYDEMQPPPPKFLYGSHYSAPGFVLFYLVRKYPHYMLCLQNGRFDHPDRMFNSVSDVWRNVQTNMSDFKELVPEFYDTQGEGDFLENLKGIQFGYRHDGTRVNDVALPPWAENRKDFVNKLRQALESDHVSANLHHWIDLIFGYKQSGEEAIKANNVFFYLCYEGAIDLENITDPNERHAKEVQIMEFGQVPKQIFSSPHPRRAVASVPRPVDRHPERWRALEDMQVTDVVGGHKDSVVGTDLSADARLVATVGKEGLLLVHSTQSATRERTTALSNLALSDVLFLPGTTTIVAASWASTLIVYDMECGRTLDVVRGHGDAVTSLAWASELSFLISGSWDCTARIWHLRLPYTSLKPASDLIADLEHDEKVISLAVNKCNTLLVTGTADGEIFLWSLKSFSLVKTLPGHKNAVNAIQFSPDGTKLVSCSDDQSLKIFDLCTGTTVFSKCLVQKLKCLAWDGITLLVGGGAGSIYLWDLLNVTLVKEFEAHHGAVFSLSVAEDGHVVVSGGEDRKLRIWR